MSINELLDSKKPIPLSDNDFNKEKFFAYKPRL